MKIGVLTAMDSEYNQFVSLQKNNDQTKHNIIVQKCGIGKVNAAVNTFNLIKEENPDIIISSGVAGGCGDTLQIMDIVCSCEICYHDVWCGEANKLGQIQGLPPVFYSPENILEKIKSLKRNDIKIGKIVSGDWFVDTVDKIKIIKQNFPDALAVDMESAAIAQICFMMNVPFISLRVISDIPLQENNHKQYKDFWKNVADNSFITARQIIMSL